MAVAVLRQAQDRVAAVGLRERSIDVTRSWRDGGLNNRTLVLIGSVSHNKLITNIGAFDTYFSSQSTCKRE